MMPGDKKKRCPCPTHQEDCWHHGKLKTRSDLDESGRDDNDTNMTETNRIDPTEQQDDSDDDEIVGTNMANPTGGGGHRADSINTYSGDGDLTEDNVSSVAGAAAAPATRVQSTTIRRVESPTSDESILARLPPIPAHMLQDATAAGRCNYVEQGERCTRRAPRGCQGWCDKHYMDLYRSNAIPREVVPPASAPREHPGRTDPNTSVRPRHISQTRRHSTLHTEQRESSSSDDQKNRRKAQTSAARRAASPRFDLDLPRSIPRDYSSPEETRRQRHARGGERDDDRGGARGGARRVDDIIESGEDVNEVPVRRERRKKGSGTCVSPFCQQTTPRTEKLCVDCQCVLWNNMSRERDTHTKPAGVDRNHGASRPRDSSRQRQSERPQDVRQRDNTRPRRDGAVRDNSQPRRDVTRAVRDNPQPRRDVTRAVRDNPQPRRDVTRAVRDNPQPRREVTQAIGNDTQTRRVDTRAVHPDIAPGRRRDDTHARGDLDMHGEEKVTQWLQELPDQLQQLPDQQHKLEELAGPSSHLTGTDHHDSVPFEAQSPRMCDSFAESVTYQPKASGSRMCRNQGCSNYGNEQCGGFCNACYRRNTGRKH